MVVVLRCRVRGSSVFLFWILDDMMIHCWRGRAPSHGRPAAATARATDRDVQSLYVALNKALASPCGICHGMQSMKRAVRRKRPSRFPPFGPRRGVFCLVVGESDESFVRF